MPANPRQILECDPLELATDQVIAACDGDVARGSSRADHRERFIGG
jgi:hypothetical protein